MVKLGQIAVIDIYNIPFDIANNVKFWKNLCEKFIEIAKIQALFYKEYRFDPYGFSFVFLISESHIAIHTFPEKGFVALDIYTCGEEKNFHEGLDFLKREINYFLPTAKVHITILKRGEKK